MKKLLKTVFWILCGLLVVGLLVFLTIHVPYVWNKFFELLNGNLDTLSNNFDLVVWGCAVIIVGIIVPLIDAAIVGFIALLILSWIIFRDIFKSFNEAIFDEFNL